MPSSKRTSAASTYGNSRKRPNRDLSVSSEADDSEQDAAPPKSEKSSTSKSKAKSRSSLSKRGSNARDEDENSTGNEEDSHGEDSDGGEDEQEYEVDLIKKHAIIDGEMHYLTAWKDYPSDQDTWETEDNLDGAKEILRQYKVKHKLDRKSKSARASNASNKSAKKSRDKAARESDEESSAEDTHTTRKRKRASQERPKSSIAPLRKNGINGPTKADRESVKNRKQVASDSEPPSEPESIDDQEWHARYKNRASWEGLVRSVRTIEKNEKETVDGNVSDVSKGGSHSAINVCLLWHTGRTTWVTNQVARAKLPQKLLDFYEDHLQFSPAEQESGL